jgi:hypothetical protein
MLSVMATLDDLSCPRKRFLNHYHQITVNASAVVFAQVHPMPNVIKLFLPYLMNVRNDPECLSLAGLSSLA